MNRIKKSFRGIFLALFVIASNFTPRPAAAMSDMAILSLGFCGAMMAALYGMSQPARHGLYSQADGSYQRYMNFADALRREPPEGFKTLSLIAALNALEAGDPTSMIDMVGRFGWTRLEILTEGIVVNNRPKNSDSWQRQLKRTLNQKELDRRLAAIGEYHTGIKRIVLLRAARKDWKTAAESAEFIANGTILDEPDFASP